MLRSTLCLFIFAIVLAAEAHAQVNVRRFDLWFNVANGSFFNKIIQTKDSGYCVLSNKQSVNPYSRPGLTRFDKRGKVLWSKVYALPFDSVNFANCFVNTFDNGFVVTSTASKNWNSNLYHDTAMVMKVDSAGNFVWAKRYPYDNSSMVALIETHDSSLAMCFGYWQGNTWKRYLHKISRNGSALWSKYVPDGIYDLVETPRGHLRAAAPEVGMQVREFDKNGNDIWEKTYINHHWEFNAWKLDANKNEESVYLSDLFDSIGSTTEGLYVLKTDSLGNILFSNEYSGNWIGSQVYAGGFSRDCGIILNTRFGFQASVPLGLQGILKLDQFGIPQWQKIYPANSDMQSAWVIPTSDYGYASLAIGGSGLKARIIKTDRAGINACQNDSLITTQVTSIPLTVDSTLHPSVSANLVNVNIAVIVINDSVSAQMICMDSAMAFPSGPPISVNSARLCTGGTATLSATGASSYTWSPSIGLSSNTAANVVVHPSQSTTYTITGTIEGQCNSIATSTVTVFPLPVITVSSATICAGLDAALAASGAASYSWTPSVTLTDVAGKNVLAKPAVSTTYTVVGTDSNACTNNAETTVTVLANNTILPNIFSPNGDGLNDAFKIKSDCFTKVQLIIYDRWGVELAQINSVTDAWDGTYSGKKCNEGTYYYIFEGSYDDGTLYRDRGFVQLVR